MREASRHVKVVLDGQGGDDTIYAGGGRDTLIGGSGSDMLDGDTTDGTLATASYAFARVSRRWSAETQFFPLRSICLPLHSGPLPRSLPRYVAMT